MKFDVQKQAVRLRKQGYSYSEISKKLGVSQSTCSLWLRDVRLSQKARDRIKRIRREAYLKAANTLAKQRTDRDALILQNAEEILSGVRIDKGVGKLLCAVLYWAEGEKRTSALSFTNSDPRMVKTYLTLLRKFFDVDPSRFRALLHLHEYHDKVLQKRYWSTVTGIPEDRISIYKKPNSEKNIREGYPGCISVRYNDVRLAKEVEFLYNSLVKNLGA